MRSSDIDRMREAHDGAAIDRHLAEEERRAAEKFALGPQAIDCDEPDECTCPLGVGYCQRPVPWWVETGEGRSEATP